MHTGYPVHCEEIYNHSQIQGVVRECLGCSHERMMDHHIPSCPVEVVLPSLFDTD